MPKVMISFQSAHKPNLEELKEKLGLAEGDVDNKFGVVRVNPKTGTYTILVEEAAAARINGVATSPRVSGPYANPKIAPFGPVVTTRR